MPNMIKIFWSERAWEATSSTGHAKEKKHKCKTCSKYFGQNWDLKRNLETVIAKEKTFKWPWQR